jgi:hypothetical protein
MPSSFTDLGIELMATGENSGTWGDKTNTNLNIINQAAAGYQAISIAGGANTTNLGIQDGSSDLTGNTNAARNLIIDLTGTITGNQVVTVPDSVEKSYIVNNNTTGAFTVEFKTVSGTGVTFGTTDKSTKILFADGTNIVDTGTVSLTGVQTLTNKTLTSPKINEAVEVTATATELNILDGVTATTAELNYSDIVTLGTTAASKVFTADANNLTTVSGAVANVEDTLTDGATITWDVIDSPVAKVTLGGNRTLSAPSGTTPIAGQFISLTVIQDATGSRLLTWNSAYEFTGDVAPTLTTTASKADVFVFKYNGTVWLEVGRNLNLSIT